MKTSRNALPIDIPVDNTPVPFFNQDTYAQSPQLNVKEKPGFIETFKGAFHEANVFSTTADYLKDISASNPWFENPDPNYNPSDDRSNFDGLQEKYWGHVLKGKSPNDTKARYFEALRRQEQDNGYKDGSFIAMMLGGFGGAAISPMNWLTIASITKYAKLAPSVLESMKASAPTLATSALSYEGYQNALKMKGNIEDFAIDSFVDTIGGIAFMGAGAGLGFGVNAAKLFESNKVLKHLWRGVEIKPEVKEGGEISGYKAVAMDGMNASAAHVAEAQKFADSQFSKSGLFYLPVIGGLLGKGAAKVNPTLRMLQSRFPVVSAVADRVFDHGILTQGVTEGRGRVIPFAARMSMFKGDNLQMLLNYNGMYLKRIGIDPSNDAMNTFNLLKAKWQKPKGFVSEDQFSDEIHQVIHSGIQSDHAAVNEVVSMIRPAMDDLWKRYLKVNELPEEIFDPLTAEQYLNVMYNKDQLTVNPDNTWEKMFVDEFSRQDELIRSYTNPIEDYRNRIERLKESHRQLVERPNRTDIEIKTSSDEIEFSKLRLRAMEENLQNELRSNRDLRNLVEDRFALSANEAKEIERLTKRRDIVQKEYDALKSKIDAMKSQINKREGAVLKSKTVKTAKGNKRKAATGELLLKQEEDKLAILAKELDEEKEKLQEMMHQGVIPRQLFTKEKGGFRYQLKNPNERLKFRPLFESQHAIETYAKATRNTILNQTSEDALASILGGLIGKSPENPVLRRSVMIPSKVLYANGFLHKDIMGNVFNYRNMLMRRILMKELFQDITIDNGIGDIAAEMTRDLQRQEQAIRETIKDPKKQAKEIRKLHKDYETNLKDLNHTYNLMLGRSEHSQGLREFSQAATAYAVSTRLGGVPLTMISDMGAMPLKWGLWPFVKRGLLPMLKTLNGKLKTKEAEDFHFHCAQANLSLNHVLMGIRHRSESGVADPYEPTSGRVASALQNVAHMSNNFFLTNQVENTLQRTTASIVQGEIMHYLQQFTEGKLSKRNKEKLLTYGLQPEIWAERMLNQWKLRGKDGNGIGGIQSRFWEWEDMEASNLFAQVVHNGVNDTIIRRGPGDAPFLLDNPILRMMFPFKGYLFASLNRYLVPTMQRPDAEKLIGMVMMMGLGSLVSPLRHLARGEDPFASDENMFMNAMRDSGILSSLTDVVDTVNLLTNNHLLPGMQNDKMRMQTQLGAFGPISQSVADAGNLLTAAATGNMNQTDLRRGAGLIPGVNAWTLRYLLKQMVESTELPKTYAEAEKS